jgi:hypothetical protein
MTGHQAANSDSVRIVASFAAQYAEEDLGSILCGAITIVDGVTLNHDSRLYCFLRHHWTQIGESPPHMRSACVILGMPALRRLVGLGREVFAENVVHLALPLGPSYFTRNGWAAVSIAFFFGALSRGLPLDRRARRRTQ